MARILPPPAERFDPITARWVTPGGPLHDPQREDFDPDHAEPLTLVGPIPRELAGLDGTELNDPHRSARLWRRRRWMLLTLVACAVAALIVGGSLIV
jgi:ferric-dicitrate binding protein FerR (iron transport regulator)